MKPLANSSLLTPAGPVIAKKWQQRQKAQQAGSSPGSRGSLLDRCRPLPRCASAAVQSGSTREEFTSRMPTVASRRIRCHLLFARSGTLHSITDCTPQSSAGKCRYDD